MNTSQRSAGLGLTAYGLGTAAATMTIGSPGGAYSNSQVASFVASDHWLSAVPLAYVGAFAGVGLIGFASFMKHQVGRSGDLLSNVLVAALASAGIGWFLVGGVTVAFAEGGSAMAAVPHPVVYLLTEICNLVAIYCAAFFVGIAAVVVALRSSLPRWSRLATFIAGLCGILAGFFFPLFLFWLWAITFGIWLAAATPHPESVEPAPVVAHA
jgi:hypothetical protein